ncbi:MAG: alpha/beta hydrolase family protein [Micromonosporaceae bacterium]
MADTAGARDFRSTRFEHTTPVGPAEVVLDLPEHPLSLLTLGHGAGGGVDAPDLLAVRDLVTSHGVAVARITQPYRMAGRRAPAPAKQLDTAWTATVVAVHVKGLASLPLISGGRSSGARVACRTAESVAVAGLVALAFPLHPPGKPDRSRADELLTGRPTLVINGDRDPFGCPDPVDQAVVEVLSGGDHSLRKVADQAAALVLAWLARHGWARASQQP